MFAETNIAQVEPETCLFTVEVEPETCLFTVEGMA